MGKKKVAILLCDDHYPEAIEQFGDYSQTIAKLFDDGFELYGSWNCYLDEFPTANQQLEADIWLVSGSKYSVNDDDSWVAQLEQLVKQLDEKEKRLFGICFGHQMIHKALGGKVEQRKEGFAVGLKPVYIDDFSPLPLSGESLLFMHQEEVTSLGKGFRRIGYSEHCENAVTIDQKGNLTVQYHPEFVIDFFALLCQRVEFDNKQAIVEACYQGKERYHRQSSNFIKALNHYLLSV